MSLLLFTKSAEVFREMIDEAWGELKYEEDHFMKLYLAQLLEKFLYHDDAKKNTRPVCEVFYENLEIPLREAMRKQWQLGDTILFSTGISAFSREMQKMGVDYYLNYCRLAYQFVLSHLRRDVPESGIPEILKKLASDARPYRRVLVYVSKNHIAEKNIDMLFKRYFIERKENDLRLLQECGIPLLPFAEADDKLTIQ